MKILKVSCVMIAFTCLIQKGSAENMIPADSVIIASPNGNITLKLTAQKNELSYAVNFNKAPVIQSSHLGLQINGKTIGINVSIGKVQQSKVQNVYAYRGVHSVADNRYTNARILLNGAAPFTLEVRVFNNGVALRYVIESGDSAVVDKDNTEFVIPSGSIIWSQSNIRSYEGKYGKRLIDTLSKGGLIGPPATIVLPGNTGFAAITEGGLTDFAGMSLIVNAERSLQANLTGKTKKYGKIETPWRIIEIGRDLNTLVNCDIVANVSPAYDSKLFPGGYNTDWIKPGRSVWSWLANRGRVTLENMKKFSDLASQLGFEYNLVDEGWSNWKDTVNHRDHWDMMKELVDYSAARGVKIWVWKAYPDRGGIAGIKDPEQRKIFFQKCKKLGIVGMKVDFFDSEAQGIIQFYQAALKDAARYQLMMDFHGANKPTGETRTWPNELSREGIRGLEDSPPWALANTIFPFTRYLAGHADFTPVHFGNRLGDVTWAHHVASMTIFTSPFMCLGADPQSILDNPCKNMIQSIPTTWDETIVLPQSRIGELAVYARRKGNTWFVAAMSSIQSTSIRLKLSFLDKGNYKASLINDDLAKQAAVVLSSKNVTASTQLNVPLYVNGGFIARFEKDHN